MHEWWHGTPTGDLGPSTPHAIHVGTLAAATQALNARIGIPVTGKWDGSRTYGETKLAGQRTLRGRDEFLLTGHNCCDAPEEDYYPRERADRPIYAGNQHVRDEFRPNIFPVQIVGRMSNTPSTPMSDTRANATMAGQLKRGTAKRGYYYINEGEDAGSVSAVVPGLSHLVRENPVSSAADYPDFEAALQAASSRFGATHVVRQGNRSAVIYSPTSKGYERRSLSCDRGFFHWPKQADLVDEVPENAERVVDVLDLGFDPDAPPRREAAPQRRAAEEARGSDRERWDKLQSEFRRLTDEMTKVESEAHVKWGPHGLRYASRTLQTKHGKLVASRNRVYEKIFAMTQKLSPRDWGTGVPTHWIAGKLTFDDMVRPQSEPLSVTPPLAYGATTPMQEGAREMGAVREVMEGRGREGRRYESAQWLEFECEPATPTPELEDMAREFNHLVLEFLESYARTWSIDTSSLDADSFTWNAYASLVGHGVGLWEGDGDTGLRGEDEKKIDKALRTGWYAPGSARGKLHNLAHRISDECAMLQGPEGREAREEASIPTKAQLKIINAFRDRRLMGNPMRDSISTDGDTIYSYRMPIARRTSNGGVSIVDPAGAPSATTRNHIYGLQRTFTPAEIAGTQRAAEHDDDRGPETERMPAPASPPRLQPGYAFYTPSRRKGDWKKIPNDDWEHVVIGEDEIEKSNFVGYRLIDGSMHDIFEVYFSAYPREGRGYYAQLQTHTQGRGSAHEGAVLLDHMANDFSSPKEAIEHAQRAWGATHVDFHGTRIHPTVYGTKDGARWKKTLFKQKGKLHWPDKFSKGPKRLSGAIELTPVAAPTHTPPMRTPPMSPSIPPDDYERHLPSYSDEAREGSIDRRVPSADTRYTSRQSSQDALRDDVSFEGRWIGSVRGPFRSRQGDFYEWSTSGHSGRNGTRRHALNALVHAHKMRTGAREVRENPATDLQDAIPWVRVTRDPERYKEALARAQKIGPVDDARKVYELVGPALMKEDQETFIVVLIDVRQNCRGVAEIHRGARSRVATSVLDVMRVVVASGAEGFIVCHNHPSGKAMPSDADRDLTKAIERAAKPFKGETAFLDHVVIGAGEYYSFADSKLHKAKN
jgi:hypothetical protein